MTFRAVLAAMWRRWYVLAVSLVAAIGVFSMWSSEGGIYTTTTIVSFSAPDTASLSPKSGFGDSSLIAFARSVSAQVNVGRHPVSYSEDSAPYFGAGLRQGARIAVPSDGNQFYQSFKRAEVDIEIVGRTREWVAQQQSYLVSKVLTAAQTQQNSFVADSAPRITAAVLPLTQEISDVTPTRTAQIEAVAALLFGALIVAAGGSVALERLPATRRRTPRPTRRPSLRLGGSLT